jgi:hypothetical protein
MQELPHKVRFSDLCKELRDFIEGNASLSTVKDFFTVFWNSVEDQHDINDEVIAKTEILEIAVNSFENGYFIKDDLQKILEENEG